MSNETPFKKCSNCKGTGLPTRADSDLADTCETCNGSGLDPTFCKDCGTPTTPGAGAARCSDCWDSRNGYSTNPLDDKDEPDDWF